MSQRGIGRWSAGLFIIDHVTLKTVLSLISADKSLCIGMDYIRTKPFGDSGRIALTCNKQNPIARKLYERKGFCATGNEDDDEIELAMMIE